MFRTPSVALSVALFTSLLACQQGQLPPNPDAQPPNPDKIRAAVDTRNQVPGQGSAVASQGKASKGAVSGSVDLAPGIVAPEGATLFVIARKKGVTSGPPLAVLSLTPETWPVSFSLSQANVMLPTAVFEGTLTLKAKLDADGNAMTKGEHDLEVVWPGVVTPGQDGIGLILGGNGEEPAAKAVSPKGVATASKTVKGEAGTISGTISLANGLAAQTGAVLFIMAKAPAGGPPAAVIRLEPSSFPLTFELDKEDQMISGQPFDGSYKISARLDGDGDAMSKSPSDLVGETPSAVSVGTGGIELVLTPLGSGHK